jgi:hypothetical protein
MSVAGKTETGFDESFAQLVEGFPAPIVRLMRRVMRTVEESHPELGRKVQRGWQAVAYRHVKAGYVCGAFIRSDRVYLLFEHGRQLSDPDRVLEGDGKQVRFIPFRPGDKIDRTIVALYISEAIGLRA